MTDPLPRRGADLKSRRVNVEMMLARRFNAREDDLREFDLVQ
jgi:hypothetical protein